MAKYSFKNNILIVCEGTSTEPNYFRFIAENISYTKKIWDKVDVSDNKTIPNDKSISKKTKLGKHKKREFKNPNKHKHGGINALEKLCIKYYGEKEGSSIYKKDKAVPLRYVAQAQLIDKDTHPLYQELWAVYDKNGHSHHKNAYQKAKIKTNGKVVNIGFSSRSFEQWILLHFIRTDKKFEITECKENKKPKECNNSNGCEGKVCLCGYIRANTSLINSAKSNKLKDLKEMMDILLNKNNLQSAFENAAWLRFKQGKLSDYNKEKIYELNPYTNVDILVRKLLDYKKVFVWADFDKEIVFEEYKFILRKTEITVEIKIIENKLPTKVFAFIIIRLLDSYNFTVKT